MPEASPATDVTERPHLDCTHCRTARSELVFCQPVGTDHAQWGDIPSWGHGPLIPDRHPLNSGLERCACDCHDIWRFVHGYPVPS